LAETQKQTNNKLAYELKTSKAKLAQYRNSKPDHDSTGYALADSVINDCEELVLGKDTELAIKDTVINSLDKQIVLKDKEIKIHELKDIMSNKQLSIQQDRIDIRDQRIKQLKKRNIILGTVGGVGVGLGVGYLIYTLVK